jgi:hypothetical protein
METSPTGLTTDDCSLLESHHFLDWSLSGIRSQTSLVVVFVVPDLKHNCDKYCDEE